MERRALLKFVALTALSPKLDALEAVCQMKEASRTSSAPDYKLQFFTKEESQLLDHLMEMIIPADGHSPGAHAAKVNLFADLMLFSSEDEDLKKQWREGIQLMRSETTRSSLTDALRTAAENEGSPKTDLEHFFGLLKQMTVNGYYTSSIGIHQDLRYLGNTYLGAFPGCDHPEHQD